MPDKEKNVVLNFKMDGQVQYADTLKDINRVMNVAAKEYKNHIAAMGKDAKATDKLAAEKKKLDIQMEGAQKRTKMLRDEYEAMAKDTNTSTAELEKMYGKLLDSERAEIALQKSLDRVNDGLSDQAQEAREAQDNLDKLKQESKVLESEQKNLTSSFKLQNAELDKNASESERTELAQKQLQSQMKMTERTVKNLEQQLEQTKKVYGKNSVEVNKLETKINDARTTISKFAKSLDGIEDSSDIAGDGLEELGNKMDLNNLIEATELLQGISDKLLELGQASFDSAMEIGNSQTNLQANLGLTADEAENLNDVVDQVFRNGVVGSIEEATGAIIIAKQTFEDLNNVDLENITNKLIAIAKRTETEVQENIRGAEQLMNGFGLTAEEALDFIASSYQNGLNRSDDFMDTLVEYAPLFEQAGFSADQMLQVMQNGLENGARNTDLVADAVKELQIRMGDGTFEDSLENFSDGTEKAFNKWKDGEATVADVAISVQKDLEKMSPSDQQEALSSISTQFEDLGINASASLFKVGAAFDDTNGKADEMAQKSPGEKWESSIRELQTTLLPLGEQLTEIAQDVLPPIVSGLGKMNDWFSKLPGPLQTFVTVFGALIAIATIAIPVILGVAAAVTALQIPLLPIIAIVLAIAAAIAGLVVIIKNWGAITDWLGEKWEQFVTWIIEIMENIKNVFSAALNWIDEKTGGKFKSITDGIRKYMDMTLKNIKRILRFVKDTFKNGLAFLKALVTGDFEGMWKAVKDQMGNIEDTVGDILGNVIDFFKGIDLWEMGKDIIAGFIRGFKSLDIPTPHFNITGDLDLNPVGGVSVPKVNVDWRAKGAIFTQPTIFGQYGGRLQGAGDAGPEAALPLNDDTLGAIGKGIAATMGRFKTQIIQLVTPDSRVLAEMVVDDVTEMQDFKIERDSSFE
ncbi:phage tail tape measure protein [Gracilibacillus sp. D59]|uniref:phage tail tape measure protein n=1 Tax=Gracilibacillus sp. D59 TaxID=3457434 RepID=UPI003FCDA125